MPTIYYEHTITSDYALEFVFEEPIQLSDAFHKYVLPTRDFLNLCMGFRGPIRSMRFSLSDGQDVDYYIALVEGSVPDGDQLREMPITWRRFGDMLPAMLETWLALEGQAWELAIHCVSLLERPSQFIELAFLAAAQAFEAITRVGTDQCEMEDERFDHLMREIRSSNLKSSTRQWLKYKLRFANVKSATDLAREKIQSLGSYGEYLVPNLEAYLHEHRDTRNYHTHLGPSKKTHILAGQDLVINTETTYLLLYGSVFLMLGMNMDRLLEALNDSRYMWYTVYQSRKRYVLLEVSEISVVQE